MKRPEQALHIQVAGFLAVALRNPTYWTSIDHGAGRMTRAVAGLRKARGVKPGIPDIFVLHPTGYYTTLVLGIELKASKGVLSPSQKETYAAFLACNAKYVVCRSVEEVEAFLRARGVPLHATVGAKEAA